MLNQVCLMGRVGRDPESRSFQSGGGVTNLSLATTETWKDRNTGEKKEATEWHSVAIFGPLADVASSYIRKGDLIYVQGSIKTRKWKDQNGQDRYTTEVVLNGPHAVLKMIPTGQRGGSGGQQQGGGYGAGAGAATGGWRDPQPGDGSGFGDGPGMDDDIPF